MKRFLYRCRNWRSELHMLLVEAGVGLARMFGVLTMYGTLSATLIRADGSRFEYGAVGKRVVTNAGVAFLCDDWFDASAEITNMNFHDSGTSATAENAADTNLIAEAGPTTRATGTKSQPSANVLRSIGTIAYTGTLAIVEHGLFSTAARTTDDLWDRTVFSVINVVNGDSIQFTYDCTLTAGS